MPKPILFDGKPKRRKKRKKRKVDYTELLKPPADVSTQCTHTRRVQDASSCSQCMLVQPSVVLRPVTKSWWADDADIDLSLEKVAGLNDILDLVTDEDE